jgi:N-acetylglucosamine repressor
MNRRELFSKGLNIIPFRVQCNSIIRPAKTAAAANLILQPPKIAMQSLPSKVLPSLLRQLNERHVLAALQTNGPLSRAGIARHTGISGPTVTRVVSSLLDAQLLEEQAPQQTSVGRPGKLVRLATKNVCVLGCVIGAKTCEVVAAGLDGSIRPEDIRHFSTPTQYAELVSQCVRSARELMGLRKAAVLGLGISVPGLLNRREGRSIVSPNVHQLDGCNLGDDLRDRLQIDATVLQECHALCLAEQVFGAARGVTDFAVLDVSEGLGLGVIHGNRIIQGHSGLAGELGHITVQLDGRPCGCGNRGCLETVATDAALAAAISEKTGRRLEMDEIATLVQAGKLQVDEEIEHLLAYLAIGLAAVINIFNPSKLFIYGRCLDVQPDLFDRLLARTRQRALAPSLADCEIVRAQGSKRLGAVAAAIHGATHGWQEAPR